MPALTTATAIMPVTSRSDDTLLRACAHARKKKPLKNFP
jgi:hypothetical protein